MYQRFYSFGFDLQQNITEILTFCDKNESVSRLK